MENIETNMVKWKLEIGKLHGNIHFLENWMWHLQSGLTNTLFSVFMGNFIISRFNLLYLQNSNIKHLGFFRSGYDHVLLESYLIPHLFETKCKPRLEKNGNKVTAILSLEKNITFRDINKLLAPSTNLRSFGKLFNLIFSSS